MLRRGRGRRRGQGPAPPRTAAAGRGDTKGRAAAARRAPPAPLRAGCRCAGEGTPLLSGLVLSPSVASGGLRAPRKRVRRRCQVVVASLPPASGYPSLGRGAAPGIYLRSAGKEVTALPSPGSRLAKPPRNLTRGEERGGENSNKIRKLTSDFWVGNISSCRFIQVKRITGSHVARLMFKANYCTKNSELLPKPGLSLSSGWRPRYERSSPHGERGPLGKNWLKDIQYMSGNKELCSR